MLRQRLLVGVVFIVAATPALAAEIAPDSSIQSVVVYPLGATVVRTAAIDLPAGDTVVVIDDLPAGIETDSLKVDGAGTGGMAIASVETRYVAAGDVEDPARSALLDAIQGIEDQLAAIDDRLGALDGRRRFLERLIEATPEGFGAALTEGNAGVEQWTAAALAIGDGLAQVADASRAALIEQRALRETLMERQEQLAALPVPGDRIAVRIAMVADRATTGTLSLSYRTPAANWIPTYDAQLTTGDAGGGPSLTIVRRAEVMQATGEDWSNVALTLSTTRTASGTAAPFLPASLVALYDAYGSLGMGDAAESTAVARPLPAPGLLDQLAPMSPEGEVAKVIEAAANFGDFRAEYVVPGRVSVESGEGARAMQIATEEVVARLEVLAVPLLSDSAYLHAAFVPLEGAPLLPGRIALYRDGTFVGNGEMPLARVGREVNLGFGVDDRVRITRVALERRIGEHGILSSRKTDEQRFKITVDNLHSQPIEITVLDRIPYAEDENVAITRVGGGSEPTEVDVDDRRGVLAWTYTYEPGESREILNGYEVSWPADRQVMMN